MSLGVTIDQLRAARADGTAIIAAVAYDIVGLEAIVAAGERTGRPIIAQVGSSAFRHVDRGALVAAASSLATSAATPVGLHLDHARDLDEIRACLDAGYTSVMIDGSHLDLRANVDVTRRVVELAHPYGAWVEAELGRIEGDEDRSTHASGGAPTDPGDAAVFVAETGVDALAVCIGNVHGRTSQPVALDLRLLTSIAARVEAPLVLHGASGVAPTTIADVVARGVAKLNLNADLRAAYLAAVDARRATHRDDDLVAMLGAARTAVTDQLVAAAVAADSD